MNEFTKGEWVKDYGMSVGHIKVIINGGERTPTVARYDLAAMSRTEEEKSANAELIAAAGTAATELAEAGYDAVEVFRALPDIVADWRSKITMIDSVATRAVTIDSHDLLRRVKGE